MDFTTEDLTATAASGAYTPVSGTLTWLPGDTSPQYISVPVNGESIQPGLEFGVLLSNPTNATVGNAFASGVIEYTGYATTTTLTSQWGTNALVGVTQTLEAAVYKRKTQSEPGPGLGDVLRWNDTAGNGLVVQWRCRPSSVQPFGGNP